MSRNPLAHLYRTKRWRALRDFYLCESPLCAMCLKVGVIRAGTVLDHVNPHRGDVEAFWEGPFQVLCASHHSSTKQHHERTPERGCNERGEPLDPNSHWWKS